MCELRYRENPKLPKLLDIPKVTERTSQLKAAPPDYQSEGTTLDFV